MPTPTDPHARRVAILSAVIALAALTLAALVTHRLDATREALQTAKASCSGLVRSSVEGGAPTGADDSVGPDYDERDDVQSESTGGRRSADPPGDVGSKSISPK